MVETGLSAGQVARRLAVSTDRVDQLAKAGRLSFTTTVLGRLYEPESVERLAADRAEQATRDPRVKAPAAAT